MNGRRLLEDLSQVSSTLSRDPKRSVCLALPFESRPNEAGAPAQSSTSVV
jgi:hypothetical protein